MILLRIIGHVRYDVHMQKTFTATEARKNFFALLKMAKTPGVHVTIMHEGDTGFVLMSQDEFEGWMETMDIMADPDPTLDRDIRRGIQEMKSGKRPRGTISLDELKKELKL